MRCVIVPSVSHFRRAIRGKSVVVRCRQGVVDVYPAPEISNPNTSDQQASRGAWSRGSAAWRERTSDEKSAWSAYAREFERRFERQTAEPLTGYRLFQSSAKFRQILGLPIRAEAPRTAPPDGVTRVELLPCPDAGTIRLRLHHDHATGRGLRVVVSQSPGKQASRKPQRREARHIRGWGAASTAPLPARGGEVEFRNVRFPVQPGQRFGVWVRIVRESDGLAALEFFADLTQGEFLGEDPAHPSIKVPQSPVERLSRGVDTAATLLPAISTSCRTDGKCGLVPTAIGKALALELARLRSFCRVRDRSPEALRALQTVFQLFHGIAQPQAALSQAFPGTFNLILSLGQVLLRRRRTIHLAGMC